MGPYPWFWQPSVSQRQPDSPVLCIIGEQTEQDDQITLLKDKIPGLPVAHALLNDWFNAWETA